MKPEIIGKIEAIFGKNFKIYPTPEYANQDWQSSLMAFQKGTPKYALDETDKLIGLNLSETEVSDKLWNDISAALSKAKVNLLALDLSDNKLTDFSLTNITSSLEKLNLDGNDIDSLPDEIASQGPDAVLRFFKSLQEQGARELFEVKMLIVGEGETGKTTLWNLLQNPNHPVPDPDQKSTVGIQIKEGWKFNHIYRPEDEFIVNLWDFGGQDIQYMTHQFFLTHRSFYVLLADGRREVANFPYWLQIIELLGCEKNMENPLPVLVVLNEKGNPIAKMPYDPETVKKDYPKLNIIKREVDFGKKEDSRMEALTTKIKQILCSDIDHLPLTIPVFWDNIRKELFDLRQGKVNHINAQRFEEICIRNGLNDPQSQADLSQLLHDLGIILHFREDINLADFIILNPQWAVNAVYEIMKHEEVKKENQGRFNHELLQRIWSAKGFTTGEQSNLLNLMLKNNLEVCFRAAENGNEIYIAPQLLPDTTPSDHKWDGSPETLRYVYHYPFMPKGIIGRLIVRLNEYIESRERKKMVWENGMVMEKEGCRAEVQYINDKDQGRQIIKIEVQGKSAEDKKNVLRDIRQELDGIHKRSFPSLKVFQKVPCNCTECEKSVDPFEHDYQKLMENKRKNGKNAEAQCGKSFVNVPVRKLLEGVFKEEEILRKAESVEKNNINIENKIIMPEQPKPTNDPSSIFAYTAVFVIVAGIVGVLISSVDTIKGIIGIVAIVIFILVLGALQLRNDDRLSEKSFMDLIIMILKKIPPLNLFLKDK